MELCECGCGAELPVTGEIPNHEGKLYAHWECIERQQDLDKETADSIFACMCDD